MSSNSWVSDCTWRAHHPEEPLQRVNGAENAIDEVYIAAASGQRVKVGEEQVEQFFRLGEILTQKRLVFYHTLRLVGSCNRCFRVLEIALYCVQDPINELSGFEG